MEQVLQDIRARIAAAAADGTRLFLQGGGSKRFYGHTPQGDVLDTRAYQGVIDYDPSELVVTARCGTPLAELERMLEGQQQMLAFEPPHFGAATVGGMVASGLSGPRRMSAGPLRDFVLGAALVDGKGTLLHFGGRVMKNVAGYDVSRLLAGSLGTLGLIAEVSLKVMPRPFTEVTLSFELSQAEAGASLHAWAARAIPLSASCWHAGVLSVRLSGSNAAVNQARGLLGGDIMHEPGPFWRGLREQRHAFFQAAAAKGLWRVAVPATAPVMEGHGDQLIEWGGALRWLAQSEEMDSPRALARRLGGHATLFRGGDKDIGVFQPLTPALAGIHQRLKHAFDPGGVFDPNRMYRSNPHAD